MGITPASSAPVVAPVPFGDWLEKWLNGICWEKTLGEMGRHVFFCGMCNCLLIANRDDDEIYLDRYTHAGGVCDECACHATPKRVPPYTRTVTWMTDNDMWGCEVATGMDEMICWECMKKAVAFINPGYLENRTYREPYWVCEDHLGVETPQLTRDRTSTRDRHQEPDEFRAVREAVEIMLALQN